MSDSKEPVVVEQSFDVTQEALWDAITQREQMIQWFFGEIPEFEAREGFTTQFEIDTGERVFLHLWKITEVIPGRKIVYDWRYEQYPGIGKVTFEVLRDDGGSRLRVTNEGLDSFPSDVPEFSRESCEGGWAYLIQGNLKQFLSGH